MVLGLSLAGGSPDIHSWLHGSDHTPESDQAQSALAQPEDHLCAVVLFAAGVEYGAANVFTAPPLAVAPSPPARYSELFLAIPRYLLQPERGPPAV